MTGLQPLTFAALDGIAFAAERGRLNRAAGLSLAAVDLGPFLEMVHLSVARLLPGPERAGWLSLDGIAPFYVALAAGKAEWLCPQTRRIGFFRLAPTLPNDEMPWLQFGLAAQKAALAAGFTRPVGAQLVGALREMHSNIYEHSGAPSTGLAAFRAGPGIFEFVVADHGIGVLESLKSCADYAALMDHGDALMLTLTDGISRHGSASQRGLGFRPLFVGLANLSGALRFRSGNHALTMEGRSPTLLTAKPAEKPMLRGFFISVACRMNRRG